MRRSIAGLMAVSFLVAIFAYIPDLHARKVRVLSKPPAGLKLPAGVVIAKPAEGAPRPEAKMGAKPFADAQQIRRCANGYRYIPQDERESGCYRVVRSRDKPFLSFDQKYYYWDKSVDGHRVDKVTSGYTCRFKNDYPPDGACPLGTSIARTHAAHYECHSDHPLSDEELICMSGYMVEPRSNRMGFSCVTPGRDEEMQGYGNYDSKVCVGSTQIRQFFYIDYCCVNSN